MKLLSCHIENFGSIRGETLQFDGALTAFCRANGAGKTTLASFLKAMFYGMESDRANSKFGARRHFNPFGGGLYGGNVLFSVGEDVYKVERTFDAKSESKDAVTVYKNGERFDGFGADGKIGEAIFGIDQESFERTIFLDARDIEIGSTGSIDAKLNRFAEGSTDDANTETALKRLEEKAKEYKKTRADGSSLTAREKAALRGLRSKIGDAESTRARLPAKYAQLEECDKEISSAQAKLAAMQGAALARKDWDVYDGYLKNAAKSEQELDELSKKYPRGLPSPDEVQKARDQLTAKQTLQGQHENLLPAEDAEKLSALRKKYAGGVPTEEALNDLSAKIGRLTRAEADVQAAESVQPVPWLLGVSTLGCASERGASPTMNR